MDMADDMTNMTDKDIDKMKKKEELRKQLEKSKQQGEEQEMKSM